MNVTPVRDSRLAIDGGKPVRPPGRTWPFWPRLAAKAAGPGRRGEEWALGDRDRFGSYGRPPGEIVSVRAVPWDANPPPPSFCNPAVSGGLIIDCGIHEFDMAGWLSCPPEGQHHVFAGPAVDPAVAAVGDVDNVAIVHTASGGATLTMDLSLNCRYADDVRVEIVGARGAAFTSHDSDVEPVRPVGRRVGPGGDPAVGRAGTPSRRVCATNSPRSPRGRPTPSLRAPRPARPRWSGVRRRPAFSGPVRWRGERGRRRGGSADERDVGRGDRARPSRARRRGTSDLIGPVPRRRPAHRGRRPELLGAGESVAITGFGLSALDVVSSLTLGRGGRFRRDCSGVLYLSSGREPTILLASHSGAPQSPRLAWCEEPEHLSGLPGGSRGV